MIADRDRENAVKPFVLVKAHRSHYSGWMPAVHGSFKTKREAISEAETIMESRCVYCRIERWPNADGGEVVLLELGKNPGIDDVCYRGQWADVG